MDLAWLCFKSSLDLLTGKKNVNETDMAPWVVTDITSVQAITVINFMNWFDEEYTFWETILKIVARI